MILGKTKLLNREAELGDISGEDNEISSLRRTTVGDLLRLRFSRIIVLNLLLVPLFVLPPLLSLDDAVGLMVSFEFLPLHLKLALGIVQLSTINGNG